MMRNAWRACVVVWIAIGLVACFFLVVEASAGDLACELGAGTSIYGSAEWQWFPPGQHCFYPPDGERLATLIEQGPPVSRSVAVIVFALWGASLLVLRPRPARDRPPVTPRSDEFAAAR